MNVSEKGKINVHILAEALQRRQVKVWKAKSEGKSTC